MAHPGLALALYDLLHTGNEGDAAFYAEHCREATSILELGCGSGRILEALAQSAEGDPPRRLVGLDAEVGRLAMAIERLGDAVELIETDIANFDLGETFDAVLLPYNTLYALPDEPSQIACLQCAAAHLAPGGFVLLDGYAVGQEELEDLEGEDEFEALTSLRLTEGEDVSVWQVEERNDDGAEPEQLNVTYRFTGPEEAVVEQSIRHRIVTVEKLPIMLAMAGLKLTDRWADFDGSEFDPDAQHQIVKAEVS